MQSPNVPEILTLAEKCGLHINPEETTFYMGRVTLLTTGDSKMMRWRKNLYAMMSRMAGSPTVYFGLPANRVVELGAQIEL
jgi:KUP system potassium uptake protein